MKALVAAAIAAILSPFGIHQAPVQTASIPPRAQVASAASAVEDWSNKTSDRSGTATRIEASQSATTDGSPIRTNAETAYADRVAEKPITRLRRQTDQNERHAPAPRLPEIIEFRKAEGRVLDRRETATAARGRHHRAARRKPSLRSPRPSSARRPQASDRPRSLQNNRQLRDAVDECANYFRHASYASI